ncbi:trans-aconitate 2-methyltransferase [Bowmanella sp. JS7-9]|uniref:Class I SAM-dependent methyltransferase n=1 Tax=Pseudobowmanella zhangzhouensis TaxID=1537679 RepID=A0ABW1XJQ2_9ALTE|nr:class I SAM-dependent methyltransferase [Bowmanella sp. JS7-9]
MQPISMTPVQIGQAYDQITHLWLRDDFDRSNGISAHQQALNSVTQGKTALDIGCGCNGRLISLVQSHGFECHGIDVSAEMIRLSRAALPDVSFFHQDVLIWQPPRTYDFISAWDSLWHMSPIQQTQLINNMSHWLNPGGVLIFSFGGLEHPDEHRNAAMGPQLYYATLGITGYLSVLAANKLNLVFLQRPIAPDTHCYLIATKPVS